MTQADRILTAAKADADMRNGIRTKWGRFDDEEIAALKSNDDLVLELQSKYKLGKAEAKQAVDLFAHGRQLALPSNN